MNKIKASFTHFLLSGLFIALFFLFVYFIWYQQVYFEVSGVIEPLKLLLVVDVILGPLLTLVVYKKGKKSLKTDLTLIVIFQLLAFIYGAYNIFLGKPSLVVHRTGYLEVIIEKDVSYADLSDEMRDKNYWFLPVYGEITSSELTPISKAVDYLSQIKPIDVDNEDSFLRPLTFAQVENALQNSTRNRNLDLINEQHTKMYYEINFNGVFGILIVRKSDLSMLEILTL